MVVLLNTADVYSGVKLMTGHVRRTTLTNTVRLSCSSLMLCVHHPSHSKELNTSGNIKAIQLFRFLYNICGTVCSLSTVWLLNVSVDRRKKRIILIKNKEISWTLPQKVNYNWNHQYWVLLHAEKEEISNYISVTLNTHAYNQLL